MLTCSADAWTLLTFFRNFWKCIQLPDHFQWIFWKSLTQGHFLSSLFHRNQCIWAELFRPDLFSRFFLSLSLVCNVSRIVYSCQWRPDELSVLWYVVEFNLCVRGKFQKCVRPIRATSWIWVVTFVIFLKKNRIKTQCLGGGKEYFVKLLCKKSSFHEQKESIFNLIKNSSRELRIYRLSNVLNKHLTLDASIHSLTHTSCT